MMKFEYKTLTVEAKGWFGGMVNSNEFDQQLNLLGAQGWELVNTFASNVANGKTAYIVSVFKRPLP